VLVTDNDLTAQDAALIESHQVRVIRA
jgi:hypothetical protein